MAIGSPVQLPFIEPKAQLFRTAPMSGWNHAATLISAGGMDDQDADPIIAVYSFTGATRHLARVTGGTVLKLACAYVATAVAVTSPVVQAFGLREWPDDPTDPSSWTAAQWAKLYDGAGTAQPNHEQTLTIDATNDMRVTASVAITAPVSYDMDGCRAVLVGVNTVCNTDQDDALAYLIGWAL